MVGLAIYVDDPSVAISKVITKFFNKKKHLFVGIHSTAIIGENVTLGKNITIGAYAVIEDDCSISDNTVLMSGVCLGYGSVIGSHCIIYSNVSIYKESVIGDFVIIHSGTVIGSDGFGYTHCQGTHLKQEQIGIVLIEDNVEIGSNVTIDRARLDKTIIRRGTKIDNLVQIAHNVEIGENSLIVSQVGISGSTTLGRGVVLGGQVGVAGHLVIGDFVTVAGQSGVTKSIEGNQSFQGFLQDYIEDRREYRHHYINYLIC